MKIFFSVIIFFLVALGCQSNNKNQKNIEKIKIGMNMSTVDSLMGDSRINYKSQYDGDSIITVLYEAPLGASGDYQVVYTKNDSLVKRIGYGD